MMYFEFIANKEAEHIVHSIFLSQWERIYYRELLCEVEGSIEGSWVMENPPYKLYITKSEYKDLIVKNEKGTLQFRDSPVIDYTFPIVRDDGLYVPGRLAYFGEKAFPEFRKEYSAIIRKIKRHFWYCKHWSVWVPISMGEVVHAYIPNRMVVLSKGS
mgnify:CR=1 FL=1|jgi:hypothetical protein